jgi:2,4-dienoyl-CoA reductase-like NADH-dependent reductase (Old Yellow Enzyme family)/thioredoxin reductase
MEDSRACAVIELLMGLIIEYHGNQQMHFTHLDKPLKVGPALLKNRVVRPAHATNHGKGFISDDLIAYHERRAIGGVALSILEVGSVHPTSPFSINLFDPALEEGYRRLVARVEPHGMKLFQQLWHAGHNMLPLDGSPPWSASDLPGIFAGVVPIAMTKSMIDEIIESFATAARRCEKYGLDGVDVQCGHGYLISQFLSSITNRRDDDYGGPFENRVRFLMEVMRAVRSAVSSNMVVGVRLSPDPLPGGLGVADYIRVVDLLERENLIDYVNLSVGNYYTFTDMVADMGRETGYQLPTSVPVTRAANVPAIVVGRFRTLEDADQVVRRGDADMVGIVRALIADPDLVKKSFGGQADRVRPCIGCNQGCAAGSLVTGHMECTVNAAVGRERTMGDHLLTPALDKKRVVVVGGGPAGMEAARVAALRGHRVTLLEASSRLGGTVDIAKRAPGRHALGDITEWMGREISSLGVDVRLNTYVEAAEVLELKPDCVIVATGSQSRMDGVLGSHPHAPVEGVDRKNVFSTADLLTSPIQLGTAAVVIDDSGHYEALAAAVFLVQKGVQVTLITRLPSLSPHLHMGSIIEPTLKKLHQGKFSFRVRTRAVAIEEGAVLVAPEEFWDVSAQSRIPADTVVLVTTNRPNRALYDELSGSGLDVRLVGDANSPRYMQVAIREGFVAGAGV